jgi:nucleoside-diphosphate-sugar epimerase
MSKGLILITGVNGYIAAQCAKHFLDQGYSVRGTVRKLESAKRLVEEALKDYAESSRFEVVCVPDITVEGAFDEAVQGKEMLIGLLLKPPAFSFYAPITALFKAQSNPYTGVTHIAHIASPVSLNFTDPAPILHAAVSGTTSVLASALSAGSQLKTVLLMSSIAAVKNLAPLPYTLTDADWNEWVTPIVDDLMGKGQEVPGPFIYLASKVAAERAFWRWKEEKKPGFEMVAVNPV